MQNPNSVNEIIPEDFDSLIYALMVVPGAVSGQSRVAFAARGNGLLRSEDGGQTWQDALAMLRLTQTLPFTCVARSPEFSRTALVLAGTSGGVVRSTDSGVTWKIVSLPLPAPSVAVLAVSPNFETDETIFAGTIEDGVFISQNGGESWAGWNFGLLDLNVLCLQISPDYAENETIYTGTATGLFRSANGGRAWRVIEMPIGYEAVLSLAIVARNTPNHRLYVGSEDHGLWMTCDEGQSWLRLAQDQITDPINQILVGADNEILIVTGMALWHSVNGVDNWKNITPACAAQREISTVAAPNGFHPGKSIWIGFTDGAIETIILPLN